MSLEDPGISDKVEAPRSAQSQCLRAVLPEGGSVNVHKHFGAGWKTVIKKSTCKRGGRDLILRHMFFVFRPERSTCYSN